MSSPSKEIQEEMEQLRSDEIPEIDIEMAIQRKYPEVEGEVVPHNGEPGVSDKEAGPEEHNVPHDAQYEEWDEGGKFWVILPTGNEQWFDSAERRERFVHWYQQYILEHGTPPNRVKRRGQKARQCADTQGNYGMPCPHPAQYECYHHKVKQGRVFPICGNHAYVAGIQQHVEPVQKIVNCHECQLATTFGEDKDMYGGGTNMDDLPKSGRLTVLQRAKLEKLAQRGTPDWARQQDLERVREKLKQDKAGPKQQAPSMTAFDDADRLFYKEFHGSVNSGDAGMRYGYERIPIAIYTKLMRPGIETKRRGLKWDTLTPQEFEAAFGAMAEAEDAARKRALSHMNRKPDGPVNRKKP